MNSPIFLTPEQTPILEEIKALDAKFGANPKLHYSVTAINAAKALIDRAVAAGLDQRVFHPLQIWIGLHENEQRMPERLRSWRPLP